MSIRCICRARIAVVFAHHTTPFHLNESQMPETAFDLLLLRLQIIRASESVPLRVHTLLSPLAGSLGLCTLGVHLFLQDALTLLLGLGLVDLKNS